MTLHLDVVGRECDEGIATWTSRDTLIYALGVGAGQADPYAELAFTTENSAGVEQQVLPTFLVTRHGAAGRWPSIRDLGDFGGDKLLHGSQKLEVFQPVAPEGAAKVTSRVTQILDKGRDAVIETSSDLVDVASGALVARTFSSLFIRGEGGFGGSRGQGPAFVAPERAPDLSTSVSTRPDQALLYRLSGDRNPLHSDPEFAKTAGFPRPILHGLCSYGIVARELVNVVLGGDVNRLGAFEARFAAPVFPGETLAIDAWHEHDEAGQHETRFVVRVGERTVLDRGVMRSRGDG